MIWNNPKFRKHSAAANKDKPDHIVVDNIAIFDGTGSNTYDSGRLSIKDGRILAIGPKETVEIPTGSYIIDGRGMTALPGMIDAHVHLSWNGVFEAYPFLFGESLAKRLSRNAWFTLKSGVTTAREMPGFGALKLKQSIEQGEVAGPRLLVSTSALTVRGGYFAYPLWGTVIKDAGKIPEIIRKKTQSKCDFIKTVAPHSDALRMETNISPALLSEIVREANASGFSVAAHTMWADGLEAAIDAGVSSLEHCPCYVGGVMEDTVFDKAKEKGTFFVPTADVLRRNYMIFNDKDLLLEEDEYHQNMPSKSLRKMLKMAEKVEKAQQMKHEIKDAFRNLFKSYREDYPINFRKALDYGIRIAAGTDAGVNYTPHGILPKELALYVKLGMTARQAILSATKTGAELLGLEQEIGTLEQGKKADIILAKGNPLKDITDLQNLHCVMKDGVIVYSSEWDGLSLNFSSPGNRLVF